MYTSAVSTFKMLYIACARC